MAGIDKIDYSLWQNTIAKNIAQNVDNDGVKGLQGHEVFDFARSAKNNIDKTEIFELLGISISPITRAATGAASSYKSNNPLFNKAVDYYNKKMDSYERSRVTSQTFDNLTTNLYNMEKAIDKAYMECDAYNDDKIVIVPRSHLWYYRDYPLWDDRLENFNIEDLRTRTTKDMQSLIELKEKVSEITGNPDYFDGTNKKYDVDEIAQRCLRMSYEDFSSKYSEQLKSFKYTTKADVINMNSEDRAVYARARAYAQEMLTTTIMEAHTVNWDIGELKLDETLKATGDMYTILEYEYNNITEVGLAKIKSGIMFKTFEEVLIDKYKELDPTGVEEAKTEEKPLRNVKAIINKAVKILKTDNQVYDLSGRKIK